MRINQNISAMAALRNLGTNNDKMTKSLDKLSSGFRINRAADDAAGLVISEGLRSQVGGIKVAMRNAQDGISVVQTAEGALTEVHSILQRMRDLTVQAANTGTNGSEARTAIQDEVNALVSEIDRITETTQFNGVSLLNGSFGNSFKLESTAAAYTAKTVAAGDDTFSLTYGGQTMTVTLGQATYSTADALKTEVNRGIRAALVGAGFSGTEVTVDFETGTGGTTWKASSGAAFTTAANGGENALNSHLGIAAATATSTTTGGTFQVGANMEDDDRIAVAINDLRAAALGVAGLNVNTAVAATHKAELAKIDTAIETVSTQRGKLGALQNRFEHTIANLGVAAENISASESRIRDVDMAAEMASFTRNQIMTQAGTAMLAQANATSQNVLSLLR